MDNGLLRVRWDSDGLLTSVWDHEAKPRGYCLLVGRANLFQLHEDNPRFFDAWDVDRELPGSRDRPRDQSMSIETRGVGPPAGGRSFPADASDKSAIDSDDAPGGWLRDDSSSTPRWTGTNATAS